MSSGLTLGEYLGAQSRRGIISRETNDSVMDSTTSSIPKPILRRDSLPQDSEEPSPTKARRRTTFIDDVPPPISQPPREFADFAPPSATTAPSQSGALSSPHVQRTVAKYRQGMEKALGRDAFDSLDPQHHHHLPPLVLLSSQQDDLSTFMNPIVQKKPDPLIDVQVQYLDQRVQSRMNDIEATFGAPLLKLSKTPHAALAAKFQHEQTLQRSRSVVLAIRSLQSTQPVSPAKPPRFVAGGKISPPSKLSNRAGDY